MKKDYKVKIDDNYHSMDGSRIMSDRSYVTLEEAIERCKELTIRSLGEMYEKGISPEKLSAQWAMFGDDPFIMGVEGKVPFSARVFINRTICEKVIKDMEIKEENRKNMFEKSVEIATKAHAGQVDKAGAEYIQHPIRLAEKVESLEEKTVAMLHDVVEDSDYSFEDLKKEGFSQEIIDAVECLTKREGEEYFSFIKRVKRNHLATAVKIADLKDNSNLERIPNPTQVDIDRVEKYKKALVYLED